MRITHESEIPKDWQKLNVRKKTLVTIRPCNGVEHFKTSWDNLTSDPATDLIVIQSNGTEYPCKKDIFHETYQAVPALQTDTILAGYKFIKKATTQIVVIPKGQSVELETLEGKLSFVTWPDYIAVGPKGEVYANTFAFVQSNLEILN